MHANSNTPSREAQGGTPKPNLARAAIGFLVYMFFYPVLLFLSAWTLDWPMAWLYVALIFLSTIVSRLVSLLKHPDLLRERASHAQAEGTKTWDRILAPIAALYAPAAAMIVAGLDHRFGWSPDLAPSVQYLAAAMITFGYGVGVWAMAVNRFFSAVVRIQADRGHAVVTTGPYQIVRHPAYAGGLLSALAMPFMLNTLWALIPAVAMSVPLIIRTKLEDQALMQELDGYAAYASKTRFRLFPGIW
ncbi:MAG: isoprenylcysteine carboxylmethyltransferase family protein [Anaerolineales bacterium]